MAITKKTLGIERLRGHKLAVYVNGNSGLWGNGVPMEEALQRADDAGLVIASNKRLSKALVGSDDWREMAQAFPCWSGTMTAYDEPNKRIGKQIEYTDSISGITYVFPVPEEHRGKRNIILVAEHPSFTIVRERGERIVNATEVYALSNFPTKNGWYSTNCVDEIPQGYMSGDTGHYARFLWRMEKRVGLVARDNHSPWEGNFKRAVYLNAPPSNEFGVAVEGTWGQIAAAARLLEQMKVKL